MSGDTIVRLAADGDGVLARLIGAIDVFGRATLPPWALVGGLAVMVRLAEAHRVTADVDTVADDDTGEVAPALAVLAREQHGTATGSRFVLEDGTKVDVITTGSWTASSARCAPTASARSWRAEPFTLPTNGGRSTRS